MKYKVGDKVVLGNTDIKAVIVKIENNVYSLKINDLTTQWNEKDFRLETNREWLASLSDIELAKLLDEWSVLKCNNCLYHYEENHELPCYKDCNRGRLKWLQAEHKGV